MDQNVKKRNKYNLFNNIICYFVNKKNNKYFFTEIYSRDSEICTYVYNASLVQI